MDTHRRFFLLGCAALTLAGCAAGPELSRISDPDVDFDAYRSFACVLPDGEPSLFDRRLLAAARGQLEHRGYAFDDLAPDLLVVIAAAVEERQAPRAAPGGLPGSEVVEFEDYRLGRLAIDLFDVRRRQVVWHGSAEGRVSPAMMRDAGSAVEKAVAAVFEGFAGRTGAKAARAPKAKAAS